MEKEWDGKELLGDVISSLSADVLEAQAINHHGMVCW